MPTNEQWAAAETNFRRILAVFGFIAVFIVIPPIVAGFLGSGVTSWSPVAAFAIAAIIGFWAAQKDNRDFKTGRISAIVTSTTKDLAVVSLFVFAIAAILAMLSLEGWTFGAMIGGAVGGLLAHWCFLRFWVPLNN